MRNRPVFNELSHKQGVGWDGKHLAYGFYVRIMYVPEALSPLPLWLIRLQWHGRHPDAH